MKQLTIEERFVPLDESDILYIENKFGLKFPDDLKLFLKMHQGACTTEDYLPYPNSPENEILISCFLEVKDRDDNFSMERWMDGYYSMRIEEPKFDKGLLVPLVKDICSNPVCYSLSPETMGQIFYLTHNFRLLTNTLEEFISRLQEEPED